MIIPGTDDLGSRRIRPLNSCTHEGNDEITSNPMELVALEPSISAPLEIVEVVDTCAMRVFDRCRSRAVRFFVSSPGTRPSFSSVGFICQANRTLLECRVDATHLYSLLNHSIDVIYNPTIFGCSSRNISHQAQTIRLLKESWNAYFSRVRHSGVLRLQYCAGDGALVVRAALQDYPHAQRIVVVAIAPSCTIDSKLCFRVRHYRAEWDLTSLCYGSGSAYSEHAVLFRHGQSRGVIDLCFSSSTFQEFLRLEGLCFHLRQELIRAGRLVDNYDLELEDLRAWCIGRGYVRPGVRTDSLRNWERRQHLVDFLRRHGGERVASFLENLVEIALDERSGVEFQRTLFVTNSLRGMCLISVEISLGVIAISSNALRVIAIGVPFLQTINMLRRSGVYLIRRDQDSSPMWRRMALRGYLLNVLCLLYEAGILCVLVISQETPDFLVAGLGSYVVATGFHVVFEMAFRLYSPLRGRIQEWLTVVSEEDVETVRSENEEASRLGCIEKFFEGVYQLVQGVATVAVTGSFLYPIVYSISENANHANSTAESTIASAMETSTIILVVVATSVFSFGANIRRIRGLLQNLRRSGHAEEVSLLEIAPRIEESSNRRLLETLEDPDPRETNL